MGVASTSTIPSLLKDTLSAIVGDEAYKKADLRLKDCMEVKMQADYYEDDVEMAGPGLASQKAEGAKVKVAGVREGATFRYIPRTYAIGLVVTREAIEDNKYPQAVSMAKMCMTALMNSADTDAAHFWGRGFNAAYTYGNGQPAFSANHPLPGGGTFSNIFATPLPPSVAAVDQARVIARRMPGQHGIAEGYELKKVVHPVEQETEWEVVLGSKLETDDANNYSRLNIANRMSLKACRNRFWDNTTTNYAFVTNAKHGPQFRWRRNPTTNTYDGNEPHTVNYDASARWSFGQSNPRGTIASGS